MKSPFSQLLAAACLLSFTPLIHAQEAAPSAESLARGQTVYMQVCFACHQPTGLGLPGMFPPLASSDWVAANKPDRIIRMVLHGFTGPITLNGKPFTSPAPLMPPQGAALSDKQIADVLTYVRNNFGNKAAAVTPEQVAAIREAEKARSAMWTEAEILKIPVE
jgi:mono/diheme cytochrome c family protein